MYKRQISIHSFEPAIFRLQLLDALQFADREATVLGFPVIERWLADSQLPAQVRDFLPTLVPGQNRDDLRFGVIALLHDSKVSVALYF